MILECSTAGLSRPDGLDELEAHMLASTAIDKVVGTREMRELLAYTRALETEVARLHAYLNEECFW